MNIRIYFGTTAVDRDSGVSLYWEPTSWGKNEPEKLYLYSVRFPCKSRVKRIRVYTFLRRRIQIHKHDLRCASEEILQCIGPHILGIELAGLTPSIRNKVIKDIENLYNSAKWRCYEGSS